jgi:hypothetical protein
MTTKEQSSPSKLECFNCELHESNITKRTRDMLSIVFSMSLADAPCKGVREPDIEENLLICKAYNCTSKADVEHCLRLLALSVIC